MQPIHKELQNLVRESIQALYGLDQSLVIVTPSALAQHGEYSTNVALALSKQLKKKPFELATEITQSISAKKVSSLEKIEVIQPGFINFFISKKHFAHILNDAQQNPETFGNPTTKESKKVFVEYVSPNTNKPLHIGHLRNAVLGITLANMLGVRYTEVETTIINNDRGIANIKGIWAYLRFGQLQGAREVSPSMWDKTWQDVLFAWEKAPKSWLQIDDQEYGERAGRGDYIVGKYYIQADNCGEQLDIQEKVKAEWAGMLLAWENDADQAHTAIRKIWKVLNDWFYAGSKITLDDLGVSYSLPEEYESELYKRGKEYILQALAEKTTGFVQLPDGAIQVQLEEKHKLPNKILIRKDGTAIYMTFDIELARKRTQDLGFQMGYYVVGIDQELHFKQLFVICTLLGLVRDSSSLHHFGYGMVRLPEGKMSSRKGRVLYADDILRMAIAKAEELMQKSAAQQLSGEEIKATSKLIGIGAVKYAMLRLDPRSEVTFDIEKSVSLEGNSGPYIQYAYARAMSILRKAEEQGHWLLKSTIVQASESRYSIERNIEVFSYMLEHSIQTLAPHTLCTYLFELAQSFNSFYAEHPIVGSGEEHRYRLTITAVTANILRRGLGFLGISVPARM